MSLPISFFVFAFFVLCAAALREIFRFLESSQKKLKMLTTEAKRHEEFMRVALKQAYIALEHGEVPVGCAIVLKDQVIAKAYNHTNVESNATRHCEIVAIDRILNDKRFDKSVLKECTLYVTVEPCIMCASALNLVHFGKIYFGCHNERFGGCGSVLHLHKSRYDVLSPRPTYSFSFTLLHAVHYLQNVIVVSTSLREY